MKHCSTVQQRVSMVSQMLANPVHGLVSQLGRSHQVSRQTLYRWAATGRQALEEALGHQVVPPKQNEAIAFLVLTLLIETHASYRAIQTCLRTMHGIHVSLGRIAGIVKEAGHRAQSWLNHQQATTARALALDEQYSSQRGKAYLNVIDVHSGQVWATVPPVEVDGESWTLLLWYLQEQGINCLSTVADGVRYLCQELHTLLEVVVPLSDGLLTSERRQGEIVTVLDLLDELVPSASTALQGQLQMLAKQLRLALPQTLLFARRLNAIQEQASRVLGSEAVALLAWAWLRRAVLGPTSEHLLQSIRPAWRAVASGLLAAWDQAVRASSAVQNWHSIVRPHLAVHRTLSAGMLSLLAVWHNHRIAPRGPHEGLSPLQRTDSTSSAHHWLAALGYSALAA